MAPSPHPTDLPSTLDDDRLAIPDRRHAHLVASVLSEYICESEDRQGGHLLNLLTVLGLYAQTPIGGSGPRARPAPHPELDGLPVTNGRASRRRAGLTLELQRQLWEECVESHDIDAFLPVETLCQYVRPEFWRILVTIVEEGSSTAAKRFTQLLKDRVSHRVPADRRRSAGGVSKSHIDGLATACRRLAAVLKKMVDEEHSAADLVADWKEPPTIKKPRRSGRREVTDTSAAPLYEVRRAWAELEKKILQRLHCERGEDQVDAVRALSWRRRRGLFKLLRDRVMVILVLVMGSRDGCLGSEEIYVRRGDFQRRRDPDGQLGWAIRIFPGKTRDPDEQLWKFIPDQAAECILTFITFLEIELGRKRDDEDPLLPSTLRRPGKYLDARTIENRCGGEPPTSKAGTRAVLPKYDVDEFDPYDGYDPHRLRSTAKQAIKSLEAEWWCEDNGILADAAKREDISEALLSHQVAGVSALYGGASKIRDQERLSRIGTAITWALLTTDAGARTVRDDITFVSLLDKVDLREAQLRKIRREIVTAYRRAENAKTLELAHQAQIRAQRLGDEKDELMYDLMGLRDEVKEVKFNRHRLRLIDDRKRHDEVPIVDLEEVERRHGGATSTRHPRRLHPRRRILTPSETAQILGKGESTVTQWIRDGLPPRLAENEARRPWDPEDPPVLVFSEKRRGIIAGRLLNLSPEQEQLRAELLATAPPDGWAGLDMGDPANATRLEPTAR